QRLRGLAYLRPLLSDARSEAAEYKPQSHRDSVLQLGATHRQDISEFIAFAREGSLQLCEGPEQGVDGSVDRDFQGGGKDVIGRLAAVDVIKIVELIVGAPIMAEDFQGSVRDDLVDVHIGRCPRSALDAVDWELIVELTGDDFPACLIDRTEFPRGKDTEVMIGSRS